MSLPIDIFNADKGLKILMEGQKLNVSIVSLIVGPPGSRGRALCNPSISYSIPGASNLEKLFIGMKIHGLTQKQTVIEFVS